MYVATPDDQLYFDRYQMDDVSDDPLNIGEVTGLRELMAWMMED